jgi:hypothetical protein
LIRDPDRNKWRDFRLDIVWDEEKIKRLIAFRISRALDPGCQNILPFDVAWQAVFGKPLVLRGGIARKKQLNSFEYIARSTLLRPRDFVSYIKSCAEEAIASKNGMSRPVVRKVDRAFSNYLRDEFTDELFTVLPDISAIFDIFSEIHKLNFSASEFEEAYAAQVRAGVIKESNVIFVMKVLYHFSVLGNNPEPERFVFRYQNRESQLSLRQRLVVHRGLFKSLQIR